jgi:acetyltransferase-like isoleucine patch superfamily enzyme
MYKTPFIWGDPSRVHIGQNAIMLNALFNTSSGEITVGEYTFASHNVCIITGTHDHSVFLDDRIKAFPNEGRDIVIGKGVWLGSNCTILGPCFISDHAVVAAGAVVVPGSFLEEGAVYGGIPAKKISSSAIRPSQI